MESKTQYRIKELDGVFSIEMLISVPFLFIGQVPQWTRIVKGDFNSIVDAKKHLIEITHKEEPKAKYSYFTQYHE